MDCLAIHEVFGIGQDLRQKSIFATNTYNVIHISSLPNLSGYSAPFSKRFVDTNFVLHSYNAMKNVIIILGKETARWAKIEAAKQDTSVSRMLGDMLRERMSREQDYAHAARDFFAVVPRQLRAADQPLPDRDDVHDRANFR